MEQKGALVDTGEGLGELAVGEPSNETGWRTGGRTVLHPPGDAAAPPGRWLRKAVVKPLLRRPAGLAGQDEPRRRPGGWEEQGRLLLT